MNIRVPNTCRFRAGIPLALTIGLLTVTGCGGSHRVQPDVAQQTLKTTLESWKEGKAPESLKDAKPSIVVQDADWSAGAKLVEYQIQEGATPVDSNLYATVKLKLKDAKGDESEKTTTYVVGTSPVLTVFRKAFP